MKHHRLVQIRKFFGKTKSTFLESISFHLKIPTKQMLLFFQTRSGIRYFDKNLPQRQSPNLNRKATNATIKG